MVLVSGIRKVGEGGVETWIEIQQMADLANGMCDHMKEREILMKCIHFLNLQSQSCSWQEN